MAELAGACDCPVRKHEKEAELLRNLIVRIDIYRNRLPADLALEVHRLAEEFANA